MLIGFQVKEFAVDVRKSLIERRGFSGVTLEQKRRYAKQLEKEAEKQIRQLTAVDRQINEAEENLKQLQFMMRVVERDIQADVEKEEAKRSRKGKTNQDRNGKK